MPVLINEVIAEIEPSTLEATESGPAEQQTPLAAAEFEMLQTLALLQLRQDRLKID